MRNILFVICQVLALTGLTACGEADNEFTVSPCYLVFDNSVHQDATLSTAMNPMAPGIFCTISLSQKGSTMSFNFASNQGLNSSKQANAVDLRRSLVVGFNNAIIVGYGNLTAMFYAFDRECPNCFDPNAVPVRSKPITVSTSGVATCATCQRQYDLNNGGNITRGDKGKKLTRYRAATTGPLGVLTVN